MKRYATTRQKIDKSGIRVYGTTYYPEIRISDGDSFMYPIEGERLDNLANKYYGDTTLWWIIAKANGLKGKPALSSDEIIRIPGNISRIVQKFKSLNS